MTIPYGKHSIDNEDIDAVVKVQDLTLLRKVKL